MHRNQPRLHHRRGLLCGTVVLVLLATLILLGGCGNDDEESKPQSIVSYSHLDPPGLAELEAGAIEPGVPVLCYHYFRGSFDAGYLVRVVGSVLFGLPALGPREFWTTPVGEFEKHLQYFRDTGTVVMTLDEVADIIARGAKLPPRAVVLTIDDADVSVYEYAYPLLREYGVQAHLFVPTSQVGHKWSSLDVCAWPQLAEMAASGHVLIGSHTRSLHFKIETRDDPEPVFWHPEAVPIDVREANRQALREHGFDLQASAPNDSLRTLLTGPLGPVAVDLLASRLDIVSAIGREPGWLAWPYGFATAELDSVCNLLGFRGTVSLRPRTYGPDDVSGHVGRFTLTAKSSLDRIARVFPEPSSSAVAQNDQ